MRSPATASDLRPRPCSAELSPPQVRDGAEMMAQGTSSASAAMWTGHAGEPWPHLQGPAPGTLVADPPEPTSV